MNAKRWKAVAAVAVVAMFAGLTLSALVNTSDADPQVVDNSAPQTVTYRPNGATGDSYTRTYHGIASTEYNPLYWSSETGEANWVASAATMTFSFTASVTVNRRATVNYTLNVGDWVLSGKPTVTSNNNNITPTVNDAVNTLNLVNSSNRSVTATITFQMTAQDADVKQCFAGWEDPSTHAVYMPGDVIPASVTVLDAIWVNPHWFAANRATASVSGTTITFPNGTSNAASATVTNNTISTSGTTITTGETASMYNRMYAITAGGTVNSTSVAMGSYRSSNPNSPVTLTVNTLGISGNAIFDSMQMIASATGAGTTHGDSYTSSIRANGHILILGAGLTMTNNNYYKAVQVIGGSVGSAITTPAVSGKNIVSRTLGDLSVNIGTCVIIHSGYYYNIIAGGISSGNIGSANTNLSTYLVMKGGTVLDTVVGACGGSNSVVYGSAGTNANTSLQGGTFIYNLGAVMPGDYWEENLLGNSGEDYMRFKLKESTILEGGGSDTGGNVNGCTHVFLSDEASVYDAQAGPRRSQCQVTCTFMEISGTALVKHVACGTVTDGNNSGNDRTSVKGVQINVCDDPKVANLFGAGYDTFYKASYTTMPQGSITVNVSGGTFGSIYGGGYRGYVGTANSTKVDITINITGGHVLDSVYGGGRGGVDKICHENDGRDNWGESDGDTTGKSYVYGTTTVNVSGGQIDGSVYGGGESVPKLRQYSAFTEAIQAAPTDVAAVYGTTTVNVSGGQINGSVYGAGKGISDSQFHNDGTSSVYNSQNYTFNSAGELYGLEWMGSASSISYYDLDVDYTDYAKVTVSSTVNVSESASISGNVYGGGAFGTSQASSVSVSGGAVSESVYGGGLGEENIASVAGATSTEMTGGTVSGNVYGGCCNGVTGGNSSTEVSGGEVMGSVYGGGLGYLGVRSVVGTSQATISGDAYIHGNVYGGCENGMTLGTSTASVRGGTILKDVYAGGLGSTTYISVKGKRYIYITGGTVNGSVYGGSSLGNDASDMSAVNSKTAEAGSSAYVFVTNGEIGGSVYGGGYKGKTTGTTYIYVGYNDDGSKASGQTISIGNSVYGGGDVGELGANDTPFSDTMVYGGSEVRIYGGDNDIAFTGTISAAGNSCKTEGDTSVIIESLSLDTPIESVQRANSVRIVTSDLTLNGKISGLTGDNTRYSFYDIADLGLRGGSTINLYSSLKNIGTYRSLNADGMETRSSSPMNRINICNGTMFEVYVESGGDVTYKQVHGYTILSILTTENYYGAVTLGARDSPGGFVIEKNGIYTVADITDFDRCRCWFIAGVLQTVTSSTIVHDNNSADGSLINDGSQYVTVPTLAKSTLIRYTGGFMTSDMYHLADSTALTNGMFAVQIGTRSDDGRTDVLGLNDYEGAFIPDVYDSSCEVFMERPAQQPVLQITVYGLNENVNRYIGYATIFLQEVVPVEYKITDSTSRFDYIVQNKVEIRVDIYTEGSDSSIEDYEAEISTVQGSGTVDIILPAGLNDYEVYLKSATCDLPVGSALKVATVKNNGATIGWNSPLVEYNVTGGYSGSPLSMQSLTGAYIATIRFSVTGFTVASDNEQHTQTLVFTVVDTEGHESDFNVTLVIKKHPPVTVSFHDEVAHLERNYSFEYGTVISESDCPNTLDNFVGWYTDPTHYNRYNFNIPLTADITHLYASYMYSVTFNNMNGTESTMYVETSGDMKIGRPEPTWDGYTFAGWYKERELINEWDFDNDTVNGDMTLYARWVGMDYHVFFKYKIGDAEEQTLDYFMIATYGSEYGGSITEATAMINVITSSQEHSERYQFVRWQLTRDGVSAGVWEDTICVPSGEVEYDEVNDYYYYCLYAEFTDTAIWIQLESTGNYSSATISAPVRYLLFPDEGTYVFTGNNATLAGWRISGWSLMDGESVVRTVEIGTDYEFEMEDVESYLVNNTLTFRAVWERLVYTVTIIQPAGGNVTVYKDGTAYTSTLTAYYGNVLQLNYTMEDGYTFTKWMVNGQGTPDNANLSETTMEVIGNCAIYVQLKTLESVTVKLAIDGGTASDPAPVNLYLCENVHSTYKMLTRDSVVREGDVYYGVYKTSVRLGLFHVCIMGTDGALYDLGLIDVVDSEGVGITVVKNAVSITSNVTGASIDVPMYAMPDAVVPVVIPENYVVVGALTVTGAAYDSVAGNLTVPTNPTSGITISGTLRLVDRIVTLSPVSGFTYEIDGEEVFEIDVPHGTAIGDFPSIYDSSRYIVGSSSSLYMLEGWFYDSEFTHPVTDHDIITADVTIYPQILEKSSIQYTVKIYQMGLDGNYPDDPTRTVRPEGKEGQTTTYVPPVYEGFVLVTDSAEYTDFIADADVVIELMYERITAENVSINLGSGTASLDGWIFVAGTPNRLTKASVYYGETITLPTVTLTGYTHSGWTVNGAPLQGSTVTIDTVTAGALVFPTINAVLEINSYTLTLNTPVSKFSNGSTVKTIQVTYGTVISAADGFEQPALIDQYTFDCWKEGQEIFDIGTTMPARALTLTANWTLNTYVVTFSGDEHTAISASYGGESFSSGDEVPYGTIKFNVRFANKYTYLSHTVTGSAEVSFTEVDDHNCVLTVSLTADTVVTFSSQDLQFHVRYSVDGVYQPGLTQNGSEGSTIFLQSYSKTGYDFDGWYSDSACTQSVAVIENITKDWVLYGRTTPVVYTVTFNANGGTGSMLPQDLTYDAPADLTANAYTLAGSVFFGWATSSDASALYADQQNVLNISVTDITLFAIWVAVTPYSGVYDGVAHSPAVSGDDVTVYFAETALDGDNYDTGSTTAPSYVNAGSYTVYYYVLGENLGLAGTVGVTIDKATPVLTVTPLSPTYTGSAQQLVTGSASVDVTILYRIGEGQYSSSLPTATDAGEYTVWYKSEGTINYNAVEAASVVVTIAKATVTIVMEDASKIVGEDDPAFTGTVTCASAPTAVLSIAFVRSNTGVEEAGVYVDVIIATYTPNQNYAVTVTPATFTITGLDWVTYMIVEGSNVTTETVSVVTGRAFPDKTVSGSEGYSFFEWVRVGYDGQTIVSSVHVTYSSTLESELIVPGTYIAMFVPGDSISFDANCDDSSGSMTAQTFTDRSGTLKANAYERPGYLFVGWATTEGGDAVYTDGVPLTQIAGLSTADNQNVLYAVWSDYTYTSQLSWNVDGANMISSNGSFLRTDNERTYAIVRGGETATISESWLDVLVSNPGMKLYVDLEYGTILFDGDCIANFASLDGDVTFAIRPVRSGAETFDVSSGSGVVMMYNITASYMDNGVRTFVHDLGGIATVTVDNVSGGNSVAYIGVNGAQPSVTGYDAGSITFTTDHFSLYEITDMAGAVTLSESGDSESSASYLMLAALAAVVIASAAIMTAVRRH